MEPTNTEILVLGAGPGGYTAAFYAADRGKKVTLVEQNRRLGGICLNVGCIPSKALLHATEILREATDSAQRGIVFGSPKVDLDRLRKWKEAILEKLGQGIKGLAQHRGVQVVHGRDHRGSKIHSLSESDHRGRLETRNAECLRPRQQTDHDVD